MCHGGASHEVLSPRSAGSRGSRFVRSRKTSAQSQVLSPRKLTSSSSLFSRSSERAATCTSPGPIYNTGTNISTGRLEAAAGVEEDLTRGLEVHQFAGRLWSTSLEPQLKILNSSARRPGCSMSTSTRDGAAKILNLPYYKGPKSYNAPDERELYSPRVGKDGSYIDVSSGRGTKFATPRGTPRTPSRKSPDDGSSPGFHSVKDTLVARRSPSPSFGSGSRSSIVSPTGTPGPSSVDYSATQRSSPRAVFTTASRERIAIKVYAGKGLNVDTLGHDSPGPLAGYHPATPRTTNTGQSVPRSPRFDNTAQYMGSAFVPVSASETDKIPQVGPGAYQPKWEATSSAVAGSGGSGYTIAPVRTAVSRKLKLAIGSDQPGPGAYSPEQFTDQRVGGVSMKGSLCSALVSGAKPGAPGPQTYLAEQAAVTLQRSEPSFSFPKSSLGVSPRIYMPHAPIKEELGVGPKYDPMEQAKRPSTAIFGALSARRFESPRSVGTAPGPLTYRPRFGSSSSMWNSVRVTFDKAPRTQEAKTGDQPGPCSYTPEKPRTGAGRRGFSFGSAQRFRSVEPNQ